MTTVAGQGKEVSEKSLELNICAELLYHIRTWPGCNKALWYGLTQKQERRTGLDELIRNVGPGDVFMLQFKAPWRSSLEDDLYKFSINEEQHFALEQVANNHPRAVFYVFPLYISWNKADHHVPNLAQDTWLLQVASVPFSSISTAPSPSKRRHTVDVERNGAQGTATVHSPEITSDVVNAMNYFTDSDRVQSSDSSSDGIPSGPFQEWVQNWDQGNLVPSSKGPRFRGLNALFVPRN